MKLAEVVGEYVTHKQSMGMRFCTEARTLKAFCRAMGDIAVTEVQRDRVDAYLAGKGPVTRFWQRKHEVLVGFYRFAIARGYALNVPLPRQVPKPAQAFVPHIYSHDELRRLLKATAVCDNPHSSIESDTCRTLILLLYGAGLRIGEALALTLADVDLSTRIIVIHTSKFYKTRLVPLGPDLTRELAAYVTWRVMEHPSGSEGPFFVSRTGSPLSRRAAEHTFSRLSPELTYCVTMGLVISLAFMISGTLLPFIVWLPGTAKGLTCSACCPNWPPTWATCTLPPLSVISR
jgi:integrase/recombinase XerD